jgi:hypothetical protein
MMPANGTISFGICPESGCLRSYRKGQGIRAGLLQWRNAARAPHSDQETALDRRIMESCQTILQPRLHSRGACDCCGKPLVFSSIVPELGECRVCRRPYREEDLGRHSCPECDARVDIDESVKTRIAAHEAIAEILRVIPHLKHYGYLDSFGTGRES